MCVSESQQWRVFPLSTISCPPPSARPLSAVVLETRSFLIVSQWHVLIEEEAKAYKGKRQLKSKALRCRGLPALEQPHSPFLPIYFRARPVGSLRGRWRSWQEGQRRSLPCLVIEAWSCTTSPATFSEIPHALSATGKNASFSLFLIRKPQSHHEITENVSQRAARFTWPLCFVVCNLNY